jgi:hypothetical protein
MTQGLSEQIVHEIPICKITRANGGVAQVKEHLLWKHEALSTNPSSTENKQKTKMSDHHPGQAGWLKPVILATWEVEIRRISV